MLFMFCATVKTVGVFGQYTEGNNELLLLTVFFLLSDCQSKNDCRIIFQSQNHLPQLQLQQLNISYNPFTVSVCKISRLKEAQVCLTWYIFRCYNMSAFNAMHFIENARAKKKKRKKKRKKLNLFKFHNCFGCFQVHYVMVVEGLTEHPIKCIC